MLNLCSWNDGNAWTLALLDALFHATRVEFFPMEVNFKPIDLKCTIFPSHAKACSFTKVHFSHPVQFMTQATPTFNETSIVMALGPMVAHANWEKHFTTRNEGHTRPEDSFLICAKEEKNGPLSASQELSIRKPRSSHAITLSVPSVEIHPPLLCWCRT